jgi:ubiquinone/menaquinone biosynthesis C-methylase UbiE
VERPDYFDTVARLYDSTRPGYPPLMVEDLLRLSGVEAGDSVLDIGAGTGKSTEPFARRGLIVTALDPGANMLAVCKERLSSFPATRYEQAAFETWSADGQVFDLVVSGTAFHWVAPTSHARLSRVLKPDGWIGVFWHTFLNGREPFYDQLDEIYRQHAPELYVPDLHATQELADRGKEKQLLSWDGYCDWRVIRYYDAVRYDTRRYTDLLHTWSTHVDLPPAFFQAVSAAIERSGGSITKPVRTTLCAGRRCVG